MSKLRESARGQICQVRIEGHCNFNPLTVVLAHINGAGVGKKSEDYHAAYCCSACHDVVDRRVNTKHAWADILVWFYEGIFRTQEIMRNAGLIKIQGDENVRKPRKW